MVSLQGYFQWYDLSQGFNDIRDYRGTSKGIKANPNSLLDALENNDHKYYSYLIEKANLASFFEDPAANFTLFAPRDDSLDDDIKRIITNADTNTAKKIIDFSTIPRNIRPHTLMEPGVYWADTRFPSERLLVDNRPGRGLFISGHRVIGSNFGLNNGVIYQINGLLIPSMIL